MVVSAHAAPRAYIRVDQVGYQAAAPKRAYVLSTKAEAGAGFTVLSQSSAVVFSGTVGPALGRWSGRAGEAYPLDFDALNAPGTYTIALAGKTPASSPPFTVAPAAQLYEAPLDHALSFYENERDGPEYIPSALRSAPAHLDDEHAMTYLTPKATPKACSRANCRASAKRSTRPGLVGRRRLSEVRPDDQLRGRAAADRGPRLPGQLGASAGASDFAGEARFGVEWLLRMWNDSTRTLYYQVGIGSGNGEVTGDHDIWRLPQQDDTYGGSDPRYRYIRERPVFRAGPPGSPVSPNLAGRDAAAFALCFQVFAATDPELASRCLLAGEHIFELADTDPQGNLLTAFPTASTPRPNGATTSSWGRPSCRSRSPARTACPPACPTQKRATTSNRPPTGPAPTSHGRGPRGRAQPLRPIGAGRLRAGAGAARAGRPGRARSERSGPDRGSRREAAAAVAQAEGDPFGFGFPWAESDTVAHGLGLSVMASEYDELVGEPTYRTFSERWLGNVLGANAWGSSFIIGDGTVFTDCPQHQVANLVGSLNGSSPVLDGAVVEGPSDERSRGKLPGMRPCPAGGGDTFARFDNASVYRDNVQSFTTTEPALDLTAPSMLAFAWQVTQPAELEPAL